MLSFIPDAGGADACELSLPVSGCTQKLELLCDPVCQSGCCPEQKCTVLNQKSASISSRVGPFGCAPTGTRSQLGETCTPSHAGTTARSDDCLPGLICMDGDQQSSFCFKLCRGPEDCDSGAKCEERLIDLTSTATAFVCSLPNAGCDPTMQPSGICPAKRTCYLVSSDLVAGDTTVCDISSGDHTNGECKASRDCLSGYTCPTQGPGASTCRQVCSLVPGGTTCVSASTPTCLPIGKDYSYCN